MRFLHERESFGKRLQEALRNANYPPDSPAQVGREFNLRFAGRPVTAHAVRKWLRGEAIPAPDKLLTLAQWLGVHAAWLRFGEDVPGQTVVPGPGQAVRFSAADVKLISELRELDEDSKRLVRELMAILGQS
jgi:transcriptional regulator with XRE-family HTH domain